MSKKVTAVSNSVMLDNGEEIVLGSDGNIYRASQIRKGYDLVSDEVNFEVAFNKAGIALVKKLLPAITGIGDLREKIDKMEKKLIQSLDKYSDFSGAAFTLTNEEGEEIGLNLKVGCTSVLAQDIPKVLKQLGA